MISFVLFPQAWLPSMNLNISKLVYCEVRKYIIMPEIIEENMHKSLLLGPDQVIASSEPTQNDGALHTEVSLDVFQYINHVTILYL